VGTVLFVPFSQFSDNFIQSWHGSAGSYFPAFFVPALVFFLNAASMAAKSTVVRWRPGIAALSILSAAFLFTKTSYHTVLVFWFC